MTKSIYIALGANLGDPIASFTQALAQLEAKRVSISALSGLWQSPAWPAGQGHPDYVNGCAQVEFDGTARELLSILHAIESAHGRERFVVNAPRQLDLDLIDFRGEVLEAIDIQIPHPRMMDRGFVLLPLSQLTRNWSDPVTGEGINSAISQLPLSNIAPMKYLGRKDFLVSE